MANHARAILDRELASVNASIAQMASMIDIAIEEGMEALVSARGELARRVIAGDEAINSLRFEVEQRCYMILATQQPTARDLRVVIAAMNLATELERIGDHAAGIARLAARLEGQPQIVSFHKLPKMAKRARQMVEQSVQAYLQMDSDLARTLVSRDVKLNKQYRRLFLETLEEMRDDAYIHRATYLMWVGHNLERIGDRATNIAERVLFMTTAQFVENILAIDDSLLEESWEGGSPADGGDAEKLGGAELLDGGEDASAGDSGADDDSDWDDGPAADLPESPTPGGPEGQSLTSKDKPIES
jgi:phosphate transport system protein